MSSITGRRVRGRICPCSGGEVMWGMELGIRDRGLIGARRVYRMMSIAPMLGRIATGMTIARGSD